VEDEGVIDEDRSELLQAALDFSEISVQEVMTARVDMDAIDIDDDWEDILAAIDSATHSRLPVYEDSIDNIIGILYLNRFYRSMLDGGKADIRSLLMEPCFVYKTVKLPKVLEELRHSQMHLAFVTESTAAAWAWSPWRMSGANRGRHMGRDGRGGNGGTAEAGRLL
jgi:CBS domain containing-hemolysin-like protein